MGTAQYLSPEQAQGLDVTPASDLYSVGVILYEALTGRVPFEGDSAVAVALKQVSEAPRAAEPRSTRRFRRALDAVVLRALAKDPANRFASADEFMAALDAAEADPARRRRTAVGDTAALRRTRRGARGRPPPRRRPAAGEDEDERWRRWRWVDRRAARAGAGRARRLGADPAGARRRFPR